MSANQINRIREIFKIGDCIKILYSLCDIPNFKEGHGVIVNINDDGTLLVCWDDNSFIDISLMNNLIKRISN